MSLPWLQEVEAMLSQSFYAGRFHHAQLLNGPVGVGKFYLAEQIADALLCLNIDSSDLLISCGQCKSCRLTRAGTHPDKRVVKSDGQTIGVEDIRAITDFMNQSAAQNGNKVVMIENVEKMTPASANALLKTLEEPSKGRFLMLTTSQLTQLPATILSRCAKTEVKVTDIEQAKNWLKTLNVPMLSWLNFFYTQPLLIQQWQQNEQLNNVEDLYTFASEFNKSHNFDELISIINKQPELIRIFILFLTEQLKQQSVNGMRFESYQLAQQALIEFLRNSNQILGLNLPLAVSKLAYALRNTQ
jgi:DNA polymerase-3 subunit delta'